MNGLVTMIDKRRCLFVAMVTLCGILSVAYMALNTPLRIIMTSGLPMFNYSTPFNVKLTQRKSKNVFTSWHVNITTNQSNQDVCNASFWSKHFIGVDEPRGRLGNNLFQLLALLGTSIEHCYTSVITKRFAGKHLGQVIDLSSIDTLDNIPADWGRFQEKEGAGATYSKGVETLARNKSWLLNGYFQSWKYFDKHRDLIRSKLKFRKEIITPVMEYINNTEGFVNKIKICIHQRRGDFTEKALLQAGFASAGVDFLNKSMSRFTDMFGHNRIAFIFLSDDIQWCKERYNATNVFFSPFSSSKEVNAAGKDMALMSVCDHSIVTSGSFGWLGAWLGGGHVVYFKGFPTPGSLKDKRMNRNDYYPPYWEGML